MMALSNVFSSVMIPILIFLTSGTGLVAAKEPKLLLSLTQPTTKVVNFGEQQIYSFSIKHDATSSGNVKNVLAIFYLPFFFTKAMITSKLNDAEVKINNGTLKFEIPALKAGDTFNGAYSVELSVDDSKKLKAGFHYAVTEATVIWHAETVDGKTGKQYSIPLQHDSFAFELPGCSYNLGIDSGRINGHQLTASSSTPASQPSRAKYSDDGWCAATINKDQYIQVFFARKTRVTKVVTWARSRKAHWISKYTLEFSDDGSNWYTYKENGFDKIFDGNKDTLAASTHILRYTIGFNFIRLRPLQWNIQICFRFELYGCEVSKFDNCVNAIGMQNNLIPDEALSNMKGDHSGPANGRLHKRVVNFPFGWEADRSSDDYLQIDLGSVHKGGFLKTGNNPNQQQIFNRHLIKFKVTRVAVQGSDNDPAIFFVKSYFISYSNNSLTWMTIKEGSKDKEFSGHTSQDSAKFPKTINIIPPIYSRYVRLTPKNFQGLKVLRTEIYGCLSEPHLVNTTLKAVPKELGRRTVLLDNLRNLLYVCVYKDFWTGRSCFSTQDGTTWEEISGIVSIIGYDSKGTGLYGIDRHLSYTMSNDAGITWVSISEEEWARRQLVSNIVFATKLRDILVGGTPSGELKWEGSNGKTWGVSGKGVHIKGSDSWKLVANWKCCGF